MLTCAVRAPFWPQAERLGYKCGPHQIQAVLAAHGTEAELDDLYISRFHRRFDITLPWSIATILRKHGIAARFRIWSRSAFSRKVIEALHKGRCVIHMTHALVHHRELHWISVWGIDPDTSKCAVYDSQSRPGEGGLGNDRYHLSTLCDHLPRWGTFAVEVGA